MFVHLLNRQQLPYMLAIVMQIGLAEVTYFTAVKEQNPPNIIRSLKC